MITCSRCLYVLYVLSKTKLLNCWKINIDLSDTGKQKSLYARPYPFLAKQLALNAFYVLPFLRICSLLSFDQIRRLVTVS